MTRLLDINVLMALFDPRHEFHDAAHRWFSATKADGWASCPLTINGFVRILSHPAHPAALGTVEETAAKLAEFSGATPHSFWPDTLSLHGSRGFRLGLIPSSRHLTDIYLLGMAVHRKGIFATFDRRVPVGAVVGGAEAIEIIPEV
ncbi:MAG TPA: TA system VapC family ribonuclease toxin [Chthoniobacterales bacterium]